MKTQTQIYCKALLDKALNWALTKTAHAIHELHEAEAIKIDILTKAGTNDLEEFLAIFKFLPQVEMERIKADIDALELQQSGN